MYTKCKSITIDSVHVLIRTSKFHVIGKSEYKYSLPTNPDDFCVVIFVLTENIICCAFVVDNTILQGEGKFYNLRWVVVKLFCV